MVKRRSNEKPQRVDSNFLKEMREIRNSRMNKFNEEPRELSMRELTRMSVNTVAWRQLKEEMKLKPRKKR